MCAVVITGNKWARFIRHWQGVYRNRDVMQIKAIVVMIIITVMMMVVITMVIVYYHRQRGTFRCVVIHIIGCQRQYRRRQHKKYGDFGNQFHEIPHSVKIQYTPI